MVPVEIRFEAPKAALGPQHGNTSFAKNQRDSEAFVEGVLAGMVAENAVARLQMRWVACDAGSGRPEEEDAGGAGGVGAASLPFAGHSICICERR